MRLDKKYILPLLGIIGIIVFVSLYTYTFPEIDVDLEITRDDAQSISDEFLQSMGYDPQEFVSATIFSEDFGTRVFLEDVLGLRETIKYSESLYFYFWTTVYYKEQEIENFFVDVAPDGKIIAFVHYLNETAYGEFLEQDEALSIAREFITAKDVNLSNYELITKESTDLENRRDHFFEWKQTGSEIAYGSSNATIRTSVGISGDEVSYFIIDTLHIPEEYYHDTAKQSSLREIFGLVSGLITMLMYIAILIIFATRYKKVDKKFAFYSALIVGTMSVLAIINSLPEIKFSYDMVSTFEVYYSSVMIYSLIGAVFSFIAIFVASGAGQVISKEIYPRSIESITNLRKRIGTKEFSNDVIAGYSIAGLFLGYVTIYYLVGGYLFGFWSPASLGITSEFNVLFPFLIPLTVSLVAAISEEYVFRMFAIPFAKKYLRMTWLAVLVPALVWAFAHASYQVDPIYVRFIELTISGVVFGFFFIRYGIMSTLIGHYAFNATLLSIPLLLSNNAYYFASGALVIGLAAIPALFNYIVSLRRR